MLTAEADIRTEHAATYLARLCGHAGKMGTVGRRVGRGSRGHANIKRPMATAARLVASGDSITSFCPRSYSCWRCIRKIGKR